MDLDTTDGNESVKKSALDNFLSDKRRSEDPTISLYGWAQRCICPKTKSCEIDHVPHFTGIKSNYTWPVEEDFAKGVLMQFSVGTWREVADLLVVDDQLHSDYRSAFALSFFHSVNFSLSPMARQIFKVCFVK